MQLHQVHGAHGETGAVDHAADVAVQGHVVEAVLGCLRFALVLLGGIVQLGDLRLPVQGIAVDVDLGIQAVDVTIRGDDQRIDLQ